ncbi:phosphonate metabolism protein/1,5-bisphosphokinase (PRPP-forming) PhnN [Fundidesulfovibrio butyratiphilus]
MAGGLVYVMGASGAGKDSCMGYAREHLDPGLPVAFAHRYVTRPACAGGENHVSLSEKEFVLRQGLGLFALSWSSHGLRYGVGAEIDAWMASGLRVVVNGSRQHYDQARCRYPGMTAVEIVTDPETLALRLALRGRESRRDILERMNRATRFATFRPEVVRIDNSGPLALAGENLLRAILF